MSSQHITRSMPDAAPPTRYTDGSKGADSGATDARPFQIVLREDFSDATYLLEVRHPMLARAARPGQFVIVMSHEEGELIPLTIADFDVEKGTVTLVIQAVGKTTKEMQRLCQEGTSLFGLVGPMGRSEIL